MCVRPLSNIIIGRCDCWYTLLSAPPTWDWRLALKAKKKKKNYSVSNLSPTPPRLPPSDPQSTDQIVLVGI